MEKLLALLGWPNPTREEQLQNLADGLIRRMYADGPADITPAEQAQVLKLMEKSFTEQLWGDLGHHESSAREIKNVQRQYGYN